MICSSVNLDRVIRPSLPWPNCRSSWRNFRGSGHHQQPFAQLAGAGIGYLEGAGGSRERPGHQPPARSYGFSPPGATTVMVLPSAR